MVVAAVDYAAQNVVPPCEIHDYHPSLMPAEEVVGKGAYNSTKVKVEPKLYELPQPICSSPAMQEPVPTGDYSKKN